MPNTLPHQFKQTASDLWYFFKNPKDQPATEKSASAKLRVLLLLLLIDVILSYGLMGLIQAVNLLELYTVDGHLVAELIRSLPVWGFLLLGIAVIPLVEELIFRYGLRFKRGYIALVFTILLISLGLTAFYLLPLAGALAVLGALTVLLVLYFLNADAIGDFLELAWPKMYKAVFYTTAFLFGLVHITNFTNFNYASAAILLVPVLVAPQIWAGLLLGYMRVKHGFFWGCFLHAGHNAFFFILGLAFMNNLEERLNISNENYSLKVEEYFKPDAAVTSTTSTGGDSTTMVKLKLGYVIGELLQKEGGLVHYDGNKKLHRTINLSYKNHSTDTTQNSERILQELKELYKFNITTDKREQEIWYLAIEDSSLLNMYAAEEGVASKVTVSPTELILENVTLEALLRTMNNTFPVVVKDRTANSNRYNFRFAKEDFAQLKEDLKKDYGLTLEARNELAEHAAIEFEK